MREALVDRICAIGLRLEFLSLHRGVFNNSVLLLRNEDLVTICKACLNLRQVGYQFGNEAYTDKEVDEDVEDFVVRIG